MSRTDVHRPYWVQVADPNVPARSWHSTWAWQEPEKQLLHRTCGCRAYPCSPHHTNRAERRQDRHQARLQLKNYTPE